MAEVDVRNLKNKVVEKLELADEIFNYSASPTLVWEAVRSYLSAQRKGTHATRNRALVRGGGKKPWRQKGTGRARVGTIRSPLWRKGGTVFGPTPRDHAVGLPKRKRRGAMKLVLTDRLKNDRLTVVDEFSLESHRTRDMVQVLDQFKLAGKVLLVDDAENRNLYLSSRNLPGVTPVSTEGLNVYKLLKGGHLVISKRAILRLQEVLRK